MKLVKLLIILLVLSSNCVDINGEICDTFNSFNCKNETNEVLIASARVTSNICYLCNGQDCLDPVGSEAGEVECESSCYIGIDENGFTIRGCASEYNNTENCANDENSINHCFTCDSDYCNAILYPITGRLQCHTCLDEFCQPSEDDVQYCTRYHNDEKCVTIYSPDVDAVETRGCLSDVDYLDECKNNSSNCLSCSSDKCNSDDSIKKVYSCIGCDSIDDLNCLDSDFDITKRCATDGCYTKITSYKNNLQKLERGCLADIQDQCNDNNNCRSCNGTNCNNLMFPENRISCKFCIGDACSNEPLQDKICNIYINNEACITFFGDNDKVIYKDCYADIPTETQNICSDPNNIDCSTCSSSLCNTDIKRRGNKCLQCAGIDCFYPSISDIVDCLSECFVGINQYGETVRGCANKLDSSTLCGNSTSNCIKCNEDLCNEIAYPIDNRLSCLSCIDGNCLNIDSSKYCEVYSSQETCVTVFDSANQIVERGCKSTISRADYCENNQANCLQCQFDNCNVQTSIEQINYCISCSSLLDTTCVTNPKMSQSIGCKGNCYSRLALNNTEQIERGCSDSLSVSCPSESCVECQGERCNSLVFPTNRLSCYKCVGTDCEVSDAEMKKEPCLSYKGNGNSCLTIFNEDSKAILKGCYSDVSEETRVMCDDSNDISCTNCSGNNCNSVRERRGTKCIQCVGLDCLSPGYPANTVNCQQDGCYVGVDANGFTIKGCAENFSNINYCSINNDTEMSKSCLVCDKDFCNAIVYPLESRLICMDCYGEKCEEASMNDKYCEQLNSIERCVSVFNSDNKVVERGCLSTVQNAVVCNQNDSNCIKCNTNRCNVQNSRDEIYSCVSCNSKTDPNCASNSLHPNVKACSTNQCYSRLLSVENSLSWNFIEKGCVSDLSTAIPICTNCTTCEGSLCNNILYPTNLISCRHCSGDECKTSSTSKYCALYNQQNQACITVYADKQSVIYRGCYSDAADGTKEVCDDSTQLACTKCNLGSNCNTDVTRRGFKCYKCSGLECFTPSHPSDAIDCISNCYVGLNSNGENVRGCYSAFSNRTCGVEADGLHQCIACQDDFCNGITYPITNRLSCHMCHDLNNCQVPSDDNINYCPNYGEKEKCVTVLNADNKIIERGCSSSLYNSIYCNQNPHYCQECSTDGCNNITTYGDIKMCANCNSLTDPNCVLDPKSVPTKYCYNGCYTRLVNGNLYRGCVEDMADSTCNQANNCVSCANFDKCNVIVYPNNRMECLTCNSPADCVHPTIKSCIKYRENETCVTIFNGYQVSSKGCFVDQSTSDQSLCSANNITCVSCSHKNCNIQNVRPDEKCIICKSDINPDCAQKPHDLASELCSSPSDGECFAKISDGKTLRGCKGSLSSSDIYNCRNSSVSSECSISSGHGSNNKLIPLIRLRCYHCDSTIDKNCFEEQKNMQASLPCKNYRKPENCIKISYSDGRVVRGCSTDFSSDTCSHGHCEICPSDKITDGCNFSYGYRISGSIVLFASLILAILMLK